MLGIITWGMFDICMVLKTEFFSVISYSGREGYHMQVVSLLRANLCYWTNDPSYGPS
jgi:hypothetical protein